MKEFALERGLLKKTRPSLIGSYFVEKILLATPLLQWYLEKVWPSQRFFKSLNTHPRVALSILHTKLVTPDDAVTKILTRNNLVKLKKLKETLRLYER